ncbi:hypothetical protein CKO25_10310 [Thiocapsa imhoffii]|uniref:Protein BatD n=2 Tax=Thiocapsa imhoffii TaxID=382777 RepID=A0A9X0WJ17_9GAMM|nr:hypothetical protein [Thiocapsa imhoffii]
MAVDQGGRRDRLLVPLFVVLCLISTATWGWPYGPPYGPAAGPPPGHAPGPPQGSYPQAPVGSGPPAAPRQSPWEFRQPPQSHAEGTPPGPLPAPQPMMPGWSGGYPQPVYPGMPGQAPGGRPTPYPGPYSAPATGPAQGSPPRLEVRLGSQEPYLQQPIVLDVRLISGENPSEASLELPISGDVLIQRLEGPTLEVQDLGRGRREIVNRFQLILIPLRAGDLEIPPISVIGNVRGYGGSSQRFEATADQPMRLRVQPAIATVSPWLPLQSLSLNATIEREEELVPGQPVTLALELNAIGATPAQLPSLVDQLTNPGLRVYREQVVSEGGLTPDRQGLFARRVEFYTLVPQATGRLVLPEISLTWWNTQLGTPEVARLPMRILSIGGAGNGLGMPAALAGAPEWGLVWLPFVAILLVIAGYWGGVLYGAHTGRLSGTRTRPHPGRLAAVQARLATLHLRLRQRGLALIEPLRPAVILARSRAALQAARPRSSRFLSCVHQANGATDPVDWCNRFAQGARSRLRFQGEITQPNLVKLILTLRPRADAARLAQLIQELDAALYGQRPADLDFPRWKREFTHEVSRRTEILRRLTHRIPVKRAVLPALNPGA